MPSFDASNSKCLIRVYREGIASAVGHDLMLEVGEFSVDMTTDTPRISARFQTDSVRALGPQTVFDREVEARMEELAALPASQRADHGVISTWKTYPTLSERDKAKIESNLKKKVLQTRRFPVVNFESSSVVPTADGDGARVCGLLRLHGVEREISVSIERDTHASLTGHADHCIARVTLQQPDFGITPFRALMGALKVKADVDVELHLPLGLDAVRRVGGNGG